MLHFLPAPLRGVLSLLLYLCNTVLCCIPLFAVALLKLLVPWRAWRRFCDRVLNALASGWIAVNNGNIALVNNIRWDVEGLDGLSREQWYLVVANHQSWVDILVLQRIFHRRIPFLKFFLKKELIWVPLLGLAWWALDFPFMKRYSREFLAKRPHLRGRDIEITRRACEKFKTIPVSIMNFVEGTRFTPQKHARQQSPFTHLLRPRAGGTAFVLDAMGERLGQMLDVTIAYPRGGRSLWDFVCGRVGEIRVRVEQRPIGREMQGDYQGDPDFRRRFQDHLNALWGLKDQRLAALQQTSG
jgi:1-acyl-sn-glycerol-3-phosphate acyltransferase